MAGGQKHTSLPEPPKDTWLTRSAQGHLHACRLRALRPLEGPEAVMGELVAPLRRPPSVLCGPHGEGALHDLRDGPAVRGSKG